MEKKIELLNKLYNIYEDFISKENFVCEKLCSDCCTRNVTLTTLESLNITSSINGKESELTKLSDLIKDVKKDKDKKRFQPQVTINGIAQLCIERKDIPEDDLNEEEMGICPLLKKNACTIYEVRPFGCRCMVSTKKCSAAGFAEIDPFILTVNNVFQQYIEHIDDNGFSGNLTDSLIFLENEGNYQNYLDNKIIKTGDLVKNRPVKMLMVPPEHGQKIQPVLESIQKIL